MSNHYPEQSILPGVPPVSFDLPSMASADGLRRCPEGVTYPSCLRAWLEYVGDTPLGAREIRAHCGGWRQDRTYIHLMGVTGAAFRLSWRPGWHGDNVALLYLSDDPAAPFDRASRAIGRKTEAHFKHGPEDEDLFRELILRTLNERKVPVIARGVIGPPESCLITGYEEGGDVLVGWSFFQGDPDPDAWIGPDGYFRKRNWFANTWDLALVGERGEVPLLDVVYREALVFAVEVIETLEVTAYDAPRHNGLAAYQAWANHLLLDREFATDDLSALHERLMVHDDAVGTVAEGRWYASLFLTEMALHHTGVAEHLLRAAAFFKEEHDLMWQLWGLLGGLGRSDEQARLLAQRNVRLQMVPIILEACDKAAQAAQMMRLALVALC